MKKIALLLVFASITHLAVGQSTPDDPGLQYYAGFLNQVNFSIDSLDAAVTHNASVRLGVRGKYGVTQWFALKSFGVLDLGKNPFGEFALEFQPIPWMSISAGRTPTSAALMQRLDPVSGRGHFEPQSLGALPGLFTGVRIDLSDDPDEYLTTVGIGVRNDSLAEAHLGWKFSPRLQYNQWMSWTRNQEWEEHFSSGSAISINYADWQITLAGIFSAPGPHQYTSLVIAPIKVKEISFRIYSDVIVKHPEGGHPKMTRGEWGILFPFEGARSGGLFGIGYSQEANQIRGYFMLNTK